MSVRELLDRLLEGTGAADFIKDNKPLLRRAGIAAAAVLLLTFGMISQGEKGEEVKMTEVPAAEEETVPDRIFVDIGGEVVHPMLAELEDGSRVEDAIEAAGGLTEDADLSSINRAAFINDGDKIYIPSSDDAAVPLLSDPGGAAAAQTAGGKVNINTADSQELQTLTGIGPVTADKIIEYRQTNGRFTTIEDIKKVSGIGEKTFEKFRESITT